MFTDRRSCHRRGLSWRFAASSLLLLLVAPGAWAQPVTASGPCPPPQTFPLPPGILCFRTDINTLSVWDGGAWKQILTVNGTLVLPVQLQHASQPFANLDPAAPNGTELYCADCLQASSPCSGGSTGTIAIRVNGAWKCL